MARELRKEYWGWLIIMMVAEALVYALLDYKRDPIYGIVIAHGIPGLAILFILIFGTEKKE